MQHGHAFLLKNTHTLQAHTDTHTSSEFRVYILAVFTFFPLFFFKGLEVLEQDTELWDNMQICKHTRLLQTV